MPGLATEYRPKSFKTFVGNKNVIDGLRSVLQRPSPPSAFLFTGLPGTGKTTLARIVKRALRCSDADWKELNAANDRGIDAIRSLIDSMKFAPLSGKKKVILLDECFHRDTEILTVTGLVKISDIVIGDCVHNRSGVDRVENVFVNTIPLHHVTKVTKLDGTITIVSKDHEFWIDEEWLPAKELAGRTILHHHKESIELFVQVDKVKSVEIYQPGSNDKSFENIIGDKERNQGCIKFYDLQIKKDPSYIANGNIVHNCHMITKPAQEALLKALEEPPSYVHWVICTTNPEALKPSFKRRCHTYELESLKDADTGRLLRRVLRSENRENIADSVKERIIDLADGSAGQALKLLDMVIDFDDAERAISTLQSVGTSEAEIIDICRVLVNANMNANTKWIKCKRALKNIKSEGESARRPILGYLEKVLLNNGDMWVAFMMDEFKDNFFDSGKAGLTLACYKAIYGSEE